MRVSRFLFLFATVFIFLLTVNAQEPAPSPLQSTQLTATKDPTAISIISQSLAAVGAASLTITDSTVTGTISYPDGTTGSYKMETLRSSTRQQVDLPQATSVAVVTDSQGYVQNGGKRQTLPAHITKYSTPYYFPLLARMAAAVALPNASVAYVGVEAVGSVKAHHIILSLLPLDSTPPDLEIQSSQIDIFVDVQALTVIKTQTFHFSPVTAINRSICDTYYCDYRAVQGVSVPYHITEQLSGQPYLEIVLTDVLLNSGVSAVDFQ